MASEQSGRIDAAIDEAARAMTDGVPSGAVRANVVRQVATPVPRAPAWHPLASVTAVAAIAAASVVWQWAGRPEVSESPGRSAAIDLVPEPSTPAGPPRATDPPVTRREAVSVADASRPRGRVARQSPGLAGVPDAVEISPLAIAPVSPDEIELDAVAAQPGVDIEPIAIRPLAIAQVAGDQVE